MVAMKIQGLAVKKRKEAAHGQGTAGSSCRIAILGGVNIVAAN
jgi:hypothetical protein